MYFLHLLLLFKIMKKLFFLLLSLSLCCSLSSQNFEKKLVAKNLEEGILYFVKSECGFCGKGIKCCFDQTVISNRDSIRIGLSLFTKKTFRIDSISVYVKDTILKTINTELGFIEPQGSKWICRVFFSITKAEILSFFSSQQTPNIQLFMNDKSLCFTIKRHKWKKICKFNHFLYKELLPVYNGHWYNCYYYRIIIWGIFYDE